MRVCVHALRSCSCASFCAPSTQFWKRQLVLVAGSQEAAVKNRTAIYLTGASIAE